MDYFDRLSKLLQTEKEEDKKAYQQLTAHLHAAGRRAEGFTWYPVAIRDTEEGLGDYLSLTLERTTHQELAHQFKVGVTAALFSNHDPQRDRLEGTVVYVRQDRMKIAFRVDELPDWTRNGKLGADLLFDDFSYDEMFAALRRAGNPDNHAPHRRLVQVLTGQQPPSVSGEPATVHISGLNASQQEAVRMILSAEDVALVHGPPGTGKTTTLVEAVSAICNATKGQVLVVAPSNAAIDLLTEKLADRGLVVLRAGNPARISDRLQSLTLDAGIAAHPQVKEIRRLRRQADEFRDMAHKYKRHFGQAERMQRKALLDEARKNIKAAEETERYITEDLIGKAQVITATLVGAAHPAIRDRRYHTVLIDEAGQALEPACWIPILKADRVIMAGDHHQLPPTVKSPDAGGLKKTLFEKMIRLYPEHAVLLEEQYRMHLDIMRYPSEVFYRNLLRPHQSVAGHLLYEGDNPFLFIDTAGCGFEEEQEGTGICNREEAAFMWKHLEATALRWMEYAAVSGYFPSTGVIAPYRKQVEVLKELFEGAVNLQPYADRISVNTIDSFQGQEKDVIYISITRSNTNEAIGFLADIQRMNVAITRARKKLVIIGDSATIGRSAFYEGLLRYAERIDAYKSAWEYPEAM